MPGVFEIPTILPLALGIEELVLIAEVGLDGEWDRQVRYLPSADVTRDRVLEPDAGWLRLQ